MPTGVSMHVRSMPRIGKSMFRTLLVPLDGSAFGEHALPYALETARSSGAAIELVHVHELVRLEELTVDPQWDEEVREQERGYLASMADRISRAAAGAVSFTLLVGTPVRALCEQADEAGADLIVMTTHGRGGFERAWIGSVADGLVRRVEIPILLIRPREETPDLEREVRFRHILVPLDGSEFSEQILEHALAIGRPGGARYTLLRIVPPSLLVGGRVIEVDEERVTEIMRRSQDYLGRVAERLRRRSVEVATQVVAHPSPAGAILEWAAAYGADLIAMTTHGRGGLARLVLGSVADKVLRGTAVPLLLYRPHD